MKIEEFTDRYHIKLKDIQDNFDLEKEFNAPMKRGKDCENCNGYYMNSYSYPSTPWQGVKRCHMCNRIIVTHYQDAMGGISYDVINVYKEKL